MKLSQGIALSIANMVITVLVIGLIFAHTWGKAEQKLDNLVSVVEKHENRILYLERRPGLGVTINQ